MVVTLSKCSKDLFPSLYPHLSTKNRLFSESHTYYQRKRLKYSKIVINFSQGNAATLSRSGELINTFCVACYLSIVPNIVEIGQHM